MRRIIDIKQVFKARFAFSPVIEQHKRDREDHKPLDRREQVPESEAAGKGPGFKKPANYGQARKYKAVYIFVFYKIPRHPEQDEYKRIFYHKRRREEYIEQRVFKMYVHKHGYHRKIYKILGPYNAFFFFYDFVYTRYVKRRVKKGLENIAHRPAGKYFPYNLHDNARDIQP